jgi:hypothetical protein
MKVTKGDRYTNPIGKICVVKSVYKQIVKLQVVHTPPFTEVWSIEDFKKARFIKIPMPKINRANVTKYLLEFQLNMMGKTLYEAKNYDKWFDEWTITTEQHKYFEYYAIPLLKKTFKCNKTKALETFKWFILHFGLNIKNKNI